MMFYVGGSDIFERVKTVANSCQNEAGDWLGFLWGALGFLGLLWDSLGLLGELWGLWC